jgi:hypothetical protein
MGKRDNAEKRAQRQELFSTKREKLFAVAIASEKRIL